MTGVQKPQQRSAQCCRLPPRSAAFHCQGPDRTHRPRARGMRGRGRERAAGTGGGDGHGGRARRWVGTQVPGPHATAPAVPHGPISARRFGLGAQSPRTDWYLSHNPGAGWYLSGYRAGCKRLRRPRRRTAAAPAPRILRVGPGPKRMRVGTLTKKKCVTKKYPRRTASSGDTPGAVLPAPVAVFLTRFQVPLRPA